MYDTHLVIVVAYIFVSGDKIDCENMFIMSEK